MKLRLLPEYLVLVLCLGGCASPPATLPPAQTPSSSMKDMKDVISRSRAATTQISSATGNSKGTGFLIGRRHVVTCFHVIGRFAQNGGHIQWEIFKDIKVKLSTGEELSGKVVSIPSQQSLDPLIRDFAIVELQQDIPNQIFASVLEVVAPVLEVGDEVYFSGYPLATPAMVTHKGMISGFDPKSSIICVQGSINKGNSGGALCDASGRVIGVVSMREGGIAVGLNELNAYIESTSKQGSITLMDVDPLQAIRAVSRTLDTYISTGIGYAHSATALKEYLDARSELKK
jgi:S1-C subfamily serine protease